MRRATALVLAAAVLMAVAGCAGATPSDDSAEPATVELSGRVTAVMGAPSDTSYILDHDGVYLPLTIDERPPLGAVGVVVEVPEGVTLTGDDDGDFTALLDYTTESGDSLTVVDVVTAG